MTNGKLYIKELKYSVKKKRNIENLDRYLYFLIYVSWSAFPQANLIFIYFIVIKVHILKIF